MLRLSLLFLVFHTTITMLGQNNAERALEMIDKNHPQEKIHLFLNKEEYVAGETMWFKAYVFSGYALSSISTNLYIELYNEERVLLDKVLIPLINGLGQGSISLQQKWPEGLHYVRAYTKWMLNFNEEFQYILSFPLYNPTSERKLATKKAQWSAQLYPESGTLLAEVENRIAVRLTGEGKLPEKWTGYVTEKDNPEKKIVSFSSYNSQVARFLLRPSAGKEYFLHISDDVGINSVLNIKHADSGVLIKADQVGDFLSLEIIFRGLSNGGLNYKILAQMQDKIVYSARIRKKTEVVKTSLPINKLMTGVLHLTLFDSNEISVAERLLFLRNDSIEPLELSSGIRDTEPRAFNRWQISVDTLQIQGYALSVMDAGLTTPRKRSIYSDLWFGDFTTDIHNPNWYFTTEDTNRLVAIDALLISEKWKRFTWKDIISGKFPKISHHPDKYLTYHAKATRNGKVVSEEPLNLIFKFKDSSVQFAQVKTDKSGQFTILNVAFYDTAKVFCQVTSSKKNTANIELKFESGNIFSPYKMNFPSSSFSIVTRSEGDTLSGILKNSVQAIQSQEKIKSKYRELQEVQVTARQKSASEKLNKELASPLFDPENQVIFDFVNEDQGAQGYNHIFDWLEQRVAGLTFRIKTEEESNPLSSSLNSVGQRIPMMRNGEVAVYIDEVQTDLDRVYDLPISDIAMVKVIKGYYLGGMGGGGGSGAIAVYTRKAGLRKKISETSSPAGMVKGYEPVQEFHNWNHNDDFGRSIEIDTRIQLYWNSIFYTANNGKALIQFFNNDITSAFRIVFTGFINDRGPIFVEQRISANSK